MNTEFREHMIDLLKTIASPAIQMEYESNVPFANVPDELVRQWFDDFYPETELFKNSFSSSEINELAKFTEFYDARAEAIPDDGGLAKLQTNKDRQTHRWQTCAVALHRHGQGIRNRAPAHHRLA